MYSLAFLSSTKSFTHLTNYTNNSHHTHPPVTMFYKKAGSVQRNTPYSFRKPEALANSSPNSASCNSETQI